VSKPAAGQASIAIPNSTETIPDESEKSPSFRGVTESNRNVRRNSAQPLGLATGNTAALSVGALGERHGLRITGVATSEAPAPLAAPQA
jgi:ribose 5-phosphate isomerase